MYEEVKITKASSLHAIAFFSELLHFPWIHYLLDLFLSHSHIHSPPLVGIFGGVNVVSTITIQFQVLVHQKLQGTKKFKMSIIL